MQQARRISELPPYLFAELDKKKEAVRKRGMDVIDFGVGDPDLPTPEFIVDSMCGHVKNPTTHHYPSYEGRLDFREAAAEWYSKTFGVELVPESEVIALIGQRRASPTCRWGCSTPGTLPCALTRHTRSTGLLRDLPAESHTFFLWQKDVDSCPILKRFRMKSPGVQR